MNVFRSSSMWSYQSAMRASVYLRAVVSTESVQGRACCYRFRLCAGVLRRSGTLRHRLWRCLLHRRCLRPGVEGKRRILLDEPGEVGVEPRLPTVETAEEIEDA